MRATSGVLRTLRFVRRAFAKRPRTQAASFIRGAGRWFTRTALCHRPYRRSVRLRSSLHTPGNIPKPGVSPRCGGPGALRIAGAARVTHALVLSVFRPRYPDFASVLDRLLTNARLLPLWPVLAMSFFGGKNENFYRGIIAGIVKFCGSNDYSFSRSDGRQGQLFGRSMHRQGSAVSSGDLF
ncbi:hypothetical protein V1290_000139 [Bradyrhizobium sp. AZCC 1578]